MSVFQQPSPFRTRAESCLRVGVALVLLVAAFAKAHQLATTPSLGEGLLQARGFNQLVVLGEMAFAVWLLSGLLPKLAWLAAALCFSTFTVVSGYKYWIGEGSCGCFGAATIPPLWTTLFDLSVVGLLIVFRPAGLSFHWKEVYQELFESKRKIALIGFVWLLLAVPSVYAMISVQKNDIAELGTEFIGADGRKTILLEPEKWVGKKFPLLPYVEPPELRKKLGVGEWTVMLYHHDCQKCAKAINDLIFKAKCTIFVVEVSPLVKKQGQATEIEGIEWAWLSSNRNWFADTPVLVKVDDLIVKAINDYDTMQQ